MFDRLLYTISTFHPAACTNFSLIHIDGNEPINGTFSGLPEGAKFKFGGRAWQITYHGVTGNDAVLTMLTAQLPVTVDSISINTNNSSVLNIVGTGAPNVNDYQLQTSTNFVDWVVLDKSVYNNNGRLFSYGHIDPNEPARFYRFSTP